MAKRFTDTKKWDDDWFLGLPPKFKCAWWWLCDHCDGVGIQKISITKLTNEIGESVTREEFERHFADRVHWIKDDTLWIPGFIKAQYKALSPGNRAHMNIAMLAIRELQGQALIGKAQIVYESLLNFVQQSLEVRPTPARPSGESRAGDIGKDIKVIGNRKQETGKGGVGENKLDFESLYASYPLKEGKTAGLAQCRKQIKTQADFNALSGAIDRYAAKRRSDGLSFKMFSSFLGSEKTGQPWRDWVDPTAGTVSKPLEAEPDWVKKAKAEEEASRRKNAV